MGVTGSNGSNELPTVEKCDFNRQFSFDSHLLNFLSNFIKMEVFKSCKTGRSNCGRIVPVDQIMNALEKVKVQLPFS